LSVTVHEFRLVARITCSWDPEERISDTEKSQSRKDIVLHLIGVHQVLRFPPRQTSFREELASSPKPPVTTISPALKRQYLAFRSTTATKITDAGDWRYLGRLLSRPPNYGRPALTGPRFRWGGAQDMEDKNHSHSTRDLTDPRSLLPRACGPIRNFAKPRPAGWPGGARESGGLFLRTRDVFAYM